MTFVSLSLLIDIIHFAFNLAVEATKWCFQVEVEFLMSLFEQGVRDELGNVLR